MSDPASTAGLRVGLVCPYSWSIKGGVNAHVAGFAAGLRARGLSVEVLAPGEPPLDDAVWLGRTLSVRNNGSVGHIAVGPATVRRTAKAVRRRKYDLLHIHEPFCPSVGIAALANAEVPVVATFHRYSDGPGFYRGPLQRLAQWGGGHLSARIAVSSAAREFMMRAAPGEYRVIPNGVDIEDLRPGTIRRTGTRILFVGRPEPRKGLPVLLGALRHLPPEVSIDLVGTGPDDLLKLPGGPFDLSRVRAHGRVDDATRRRLMGETDVLAAPSLMGESFGIVLVEGMAAGLPVVASRITGYADVLPDDCGRLVEPGDVAGLARALGEFLDDGELRARTGAAGQRAALRYDWPRVTGEVLDVYLDALGPNAPRRRRFRPGSRFVPGHRISEGEVLEAGGR